MGCLTEGAANFIRDNGLRAEIGCGAPFGLSPTPVALMMTREAEFPEQRGLGRPVEGMPTRRGRIPSAEADPTDCIRSVISDEPFMEPNSRKKTCPRKRYASVGDGTRMAMPPAKCLAYRAPAEVLGPAWRFNL